MCSRYNLLLNTINSAEFQRRYKFELETGAAISFRAGAPSQQLPILVGHPGGAPPELRLARWGLIPHWSKDGKASSTFNARAETVAEKPTYRSLIGTHRCLVPFTSFTEWCAKVPHHLTPAGGLATFAGLWDEWQGKPSYTILTTAPSPALQGIHDRMPLILSPAQEQAWLNPATDRSLINEILASMPEAELTVEKEETGQLGLW